ncbi:MAG: DUF4038 domain-containing protein [Cyclobacteriaceae bacterium]
MNHTAKTLVIAMVFMVFQPAAVRGQDIGIWSRFEKEFTSSKDYTNPMYDLKFNIRFISPTGKIKSIQAFWDGERSWKVRFMPDEKGTWKWNSECSDKTNNSLNGQTGSFKCTPNNSNLQIYQKGSVTKKPGRYYLEHADGSPFFWTACTAWNGTLKSTDEEWKYYLNHRVKNNYTVIQFVTTQWRGGDNNSLGQVAFEGSGVININPGFFQHLDKKIDEINRVGLVAAPVLLWALPTFTGRYLSPGYYLPEAEAILLAKYMVARYGAHHVVWILGGDGRYTEDYEHRWKNIGRGVFAGEHPGVVALHPTGKSWLGDVYAQEDWLDIVGYQTGHNNTDGTRSWITQGPVSSRWDKIPPKVLINMEPVYEQIRPEITASDIRNASYWSILSAPTSGITYGANGIWPWLRHGEEILNHAGKGEDASRWKESLDLPGSVQVGYLSAFFQRIEWWKLRPAPGLLLQQPGDSVIREFISISQTDDQKTIVAYLPSAREISIYNPWDNKYEGEWFDPAGNKTFKASLTNESGILMVARPSGKNDHVLILQKTK